MSLFSQETFIKEIRTLSPTQEKIKTLALYMKTTSTESTRMLRILDQEYAKSNAYHKLNIFYLANELIQTIKNDEKDLALLHEQIKSFVVSNFDDAYAEMSKYPVLKGKLMELKGVWVERKLFGDAELADGALPYTYGREEVIRKIEEYFDCREALAEYLDGMVKNLRR
ncbi:Regulator of nuclear mRNA [Trachipleistophora hominis]|uniref:Regulator of nuclear mRNA n=1 Tax=Trachipleistophora hominis TaxID=72359 RepID=L7JW78_TRAHO|nr:Regulator of nuclear mRNA [Trachipleistophora hominis]